MQQNEIKILVDWGHIAVKTWGEPSNDPIILIHGLQSNSNTFNRLISHLPTNFYYICPDLPGHGRSSFFSNVLQTHYTSFFTFFLLLMEHFQRKTYVMVGHSFGAMMSTCFAQIFPEKVSKLFLIDHFYIKPLELPHRFLAPKKTWSNFINPPKKKIYTYNQALELIMTPDYGGKLDEECGKEILERMLTKIGDDQYIINNHVNVKYIISEYGSDNFILKMMKTVPIKQECVFIKSSDVIKGEPFDELLKLLPHVKVIEVDGDHHVHQKKPGIISGYLKIFLLETQNKI